MTASKITPPSQPRSIQSPPTPLHGAMHDSLESYSPRRSGRIDARRIQADYDNNGISNGNSIEKTRSKPTMSRTISQTYSPPSSPEPNFTRSKSLGSVRKHNRKSSDEHMVDASGHASDIDSVDLGGSATKPTRTARTLFPNMLPTPAKTPRKKVLHPDIIKPTARILFPSRPADPNDVMPTPRKARQSKAQIASSMDRQAQHYAISKTQKIPIYTDSKEREPEADPSEDNPFLTQRRSRRTQSRNRMTSGLGAEVDRAIENNEGLVYTFRGKKIFRRFDNLSANNSSDESSTSLTNHDLLRRAEGPNRRPFTRSAITPRLLFPPPESPSPDPSATDEEADTEIEDAAPLETKRVPSTPHKKHFRPATPPTTARKSRKKLTPESSPMGPRDDEEDDEAEGAVRLPAKKTSPFDDWPRTKPSSGRVVSAKRAGEPLENGGLTGAKRTRSAPSRFV